jgi:mycothiol synthase
MTDTDLITIRNYRPGDEEAWVALMRAAADFPYAMFNQSPSLDALRTMIRHPYMDAEHNLFSSEARGEMVGYAELWHAPDKPRTTGRVLVHPAWRRGGLGTALLRHIEARGRHVGGRYLDMQIAAQYEAGRAFLSARGFTPVHYGWQMVLSEIRAAPLPEWPAGYSGRTFVPGQDEATSVRLENESFQDEWEFLPIELGEIEGFVRSVSFRADGVIYAVRDGQVVGECWSWIDNEAVGQSKVRQGDIWCVCVHPQHRRRGLGRALLLSGVNWLRHQGMTSVDLCVDGANDRAKHLYEAVGFVERRTDIWYRESL